MTAATAARSKLKRMPRSCAMPFRSCACGFQINTAATNCPRCKGKIAPAINAPRAKPKHPEDAHQEALFTWAARAKGKHPDLDMLFHVPNGGARDAREGGRLKAQGVRPGVPDIFLDVPRGAFHGLRIELKATRAELLRKPTVSDDQQAWLARMNGHGYRALVCEGWESAREEIERYLGLESRA
jgi:hypothetical protein